MENRFGHPGGRKSGQAVAGALMRSLSGDRRGEALVEFALVAPILVVLTVAVLEFIGYAFDTHMAGEAVRRGARTAAIVPPIVNADSLHETTSPIICTGGAEGPVCEGGTVVAPESFDLIMERMRTPWPSLGGAQVRVEYRASGIGSIDTPGGILPMVTVRANDLPRTFSLFKAIPGMDAAIPLPEFVGSHLGNSRK